MWGYIGDFFILFLSCFVYFYLFIRFLRDIMDSRVSKRVIYFVMLISALALSLVNYAHIPLLNLGVTVFISLILAHQMFEAHPKKYWIKIIAMITLLGCVEAFAVQVFTVLFSICSINIETYVNDQKFNVVISTISVILVFRLVQELIIKKNMSYLTKKYSLLYLCIVIFSFVNIYVLMILANQSAVGAIVYGAWACVFFLILLNVGIIEVMQSISLSQKSKLEYEVVKKQSDMQYNYYVMIEQKYLKSRRILHDIRNHINTLDGMYQTKANPEIINSYKDKINSTINKLGYRRYSLSPTLNILLNDKSAYCEQHLIIINFMEECIDLSFIHDYDMVTIFGNLLDNAIYGVKELDHEQRRISLNIRKINEFIVINIKNKYDNKQKFFTEKIGVSRKPGHEGFGLSNIRKTVEKYEGDFFVYQNDNIFEVNIYLQNVETLF